MSSSLKEEDGAGRHDCSQVLKGPVHQVHSEVYPERKDEPFKHRVGIMRFMLERSLWKLGGRKVKGKDWRQEGESTAFNEHLLILVI